MARSKLSAAVATAPKKQQPKPPAAPPPPRRPVAPVPPTPNAPPKKPAPVAPKAPAKTRALAVVEDLKGAPGAKVVGEAVLTELKLVKPNGWNPNEMTPLQKQSLRQGLQEDGWIASQALLVWGKDEKGKAQNIIIDGEHRWHEAIALNMKSGPMVFLHGLTEAQAKALTVKLDNKRGKFNPLKLGTLLHSIEASFDSGIDALSFGFTDDDLAKIMAPPNVDNLLGPPPGAAGAGGLGGTITSENSLVKMVPLYFDGPRHETFLAAVKKLSVELKLENISDVVERVVTQAAAAK
jgi:hypothetical protein